MSPKKLNYRPDSDVIGEYTRRDAELTLSLYRAMARHKRWEMIKGIAALVFCALLAGFLLWSFSQLSEDEQWNMLFMMDMMQ